MSRTISKKPELAKRTKKASTYRRIVTGNSNGKSVVQSDEHMQAYEFKTVPGYEHSHGSTRQRRISAKSKDLTAILIRSFQDPAAAVCTL
jgi:hypothetical protein